MTKPGVLVALALLLSHCTQVERQPEIYEIPTNYRGWVTIVYERGDCPPLERRGNFRVVTVSSAGTACTSDRHQVGWAKDEFVYVGTSREPIPSTGWGEGGLIWGESSGIESRPSGPAVIRSRFFVGTEDEFRKATAAPDE